MRQTPAWLSLKRPVPPSRMEGNVRSSAPRPPAYPGKAPGNKSRCFPRPRRTVQQRRRLAAGRRGRRRRAPRKCPKKPASGKNKKPRYKWGEIGQRTMVANRTAAGARQIGVGLNKIGAKLTHSNVTSLVRPFTLKPWRRHPVPGDAFIVWTVFQMYK
jgi:hypothetical protein